MWKIHIAQRTSVFQMVNAWWHKTTHAYKIHSKCKTRQMDLNVTGYEKYLKQSSKGELCTRNENT